MKQKLLNILTYIRSISILVKIPLFSIVVLTITCIVVFLLEKPVQFSYKSETCASQFVFFPSIQKASSQNIINVSYKNSIKIGDFILASKKVCFSSIEIPKIGNQKISVSPFGSSLFKKTFNLFVPKPPVVSAQILEKPISTVKPLILPMTDDDFFYDYKLEIDEYSIKCPVEKSSIACDVSKFNLVHGHDYALSLVRMLRLDEVEVILNKTIKTIDATELTKSSVTQDQVIYDNTKNFIFEFNKDISDLDISLLKNNGDIFEPSDIKLSIDGATVKIESTDDLVRDSIYSVLIKNLLAKDGSSLSEDIRIVFRVSDGPKVKSVNSGYVGLPTDHSFLMYFDQQIDNLQSLYSYIEVIGLSDYNITKGNDWISINYTNANKCSYITINLLPGIKNQFGIESTKAWQYNTKTLCHTKEIIGYSVAGRPIVAYNYGSGDRPIMYIGSIHGNEKSTYYLMNDWINELELNAHKIQSDKKIIVIPSLNPDGLFANVRNNNNNIDLNRNFPTDDWQADVYAPNNQLIIGGGGVNPISEPESLAIVNYLNQINPILILSYHSTANCIIANEAGNSIELASKYASLSGYRNTTGEIGTFGYSITGSFDTWLQEKRNIASLIIELSSISNSQFNRNIDALWAMANS